MATAPTRRGTAPYHHGDLRRTLMDAAVATVASDGPAAVSLRGLAARAGVSHAAPVHHFGDKAGLFTAVATEGFDLLADELGGVWERTGDFKEVGVRYVHFALDHPGHFAVMFRPDLAREGDPALDRSKQRAFATLRGPLLATGRAPDRRSLRAASLASWSVVHGLATLILSGNLPDLDLADVDTLAREVIGHRGTPRSPGPTPG
ncbi:MAG TPA: TetR/AcrR family transcriptional regulator [Acidimicrobiales bacterium]|nr:TetR/AcrR family transcriptional regulator [Acidimicrobiales bacterium]